MEEIKRDKNKQIIKKTNATFVLYVFGTFLSLTFFLNKIDFVPELPVNQDETVLSTIVDTARAGSPESKEDTRNQTTVVQKAKPVRVVVDAIGLNTTILSPASNEVEVLDRALLSGAVHYPGSGLLGENANILLFGHSSYLPVVHNKAFKAFNELNKLHEGDLVQVFSEKEVYTYAVDKVWLSDAQDVVVEFDSPKPLLTLATCNNFGSKEERWIVTASLVSKEKL